MSGVAHGFPGLDPTTPLGVTPGTDETTDLTHLVGGGAWGGVDLNAPGWTYSLSASLQETFNSNVMSTSSNPRWDLTTYVSPGITIIGNTSRTTTRLNYSPTLALYARTGDQNSISQQLYGTSQIVLSEDLAYLDLHAMAGVGATNGGYGGGGAMIGGGGIGGGTGQNSALYLSKNNRTLIDTFGASPYLLHRFGDYGTLRIGYSGSWSESTPAASGFAPMPVIGGSSQGQSTTLFTNQETVQFTTGEYFDRIRDTILLNATEGSGSGASRGSSQTFLSNRVDYRLWSGVSPFGEYGIEDIRYSGASGTPGNPGTSGTHIHDAIWTVGVDLTPNPDSSISISYGHRYGTTSASFNASYALSPRTRISASYNHALTTDLQALQGSLANSGVYQNGILVNPQTGAPIVLGTNAFGINNNLYQSDIYTGTVSVALDRDQFMATVVDYQRTVASSSTLSTGTSSNSVMGSLSWTRSLTPLLSSTLNGSYAVQDAGNGGGGNTSTMTISASLQYTLSETLRTSAGYYHYATSATSANTPGSDISMDVVYIGITKTF